MKNLGRPPSPLIDRLMSKINKTESCWIWTGQQTYNGYGFFGQRINGKVTGHMAHRIVYETLVGKISDGLTIDHLCMNRLCVNPEHLEPVTIGENIRRAPRSISETCKYGHLYRDQSEFYKNKGSRRCHTCHSERESARRIAISHSKI